MSSSRNDSEESKLITYSDVQIRDMIEVGIYIQHLYDIMGEKISTDERRYDAAEEFLLDARPLYKKVMPKDIENLFKNLNVSYIEKVAEEIMKNGF